MKINAFLEPVPSDGLRPAQAGDTFEKTLAAFTQLRSGGDSGAPGDFFGSQVRGNFQRAFSA
jgi:hypothetical protein